MRNLFEKMTMGVVYQDSQGRIVDANSAAADILGLTMDQLMGRTSVDPRWQTINEDGSPLPGEEHPSMVSLRTGEAVRSRVMGVSVPGLDHRRWILVDAVPEFLPREDRPYQVFTTFIDITDRCRAQKSLDDALVRLDVALEGSDLGVYEANLETGESRPDARYLRMLGYAPDEIPFDVPGWMALIHPDDRPAVQRAAAAIHRGASERLDVEYRMRHKSGAWVWTLDRGRATEWGRDGRPVRVAGTHLDISRIKNTEEALRRAKVSAEDGERAKCALLDRLNEAQRTAGIGSWDWDRSQDGIWWSDQLYEIFDLPRDTALSVDVVLARVHPEDVERVRREVTSLLRTGADLDLDCRVVTGSGQVKRIRTHGSLRSDAPGQPVRLSGTCTDVTQRRQTEDRLRHAQKVEALGQLAGGIAHDFNNILAAMMMRLGLLETDPLLTEPIRDSVAELQRAAQQAAGLTRQLLLFSRQELMQVAPVDLNELVDHQLKMLRRLLGENIDLLFRESPRPELVNGDRGMLAQVVMNLCVNGRDAMPKGGRLTLATRRMVLDEAVASRHDHALPGVYVCLEVQDEGCGIDEATRPHIFDPFFTTKERGRGTGLGLATVLSIVQQHRGWVEVESEVGRGSTFRVVLPWSDRPAAGAQASTTAPGGRGEGTILVVEDAPMVRSSLAGYLRRFGYLVLEAADGVEALRQWQERSADIDLLLSDMVMPKRLTGLDLVKRMRAEKPGLKVVICSGYSFDLVEQAQSAAPDIVYLPKPYEPAMLLEVIRKCLGGTAS